MRHRRGRHHVGGAGTDRGRAGHHPPPPRRLGIGDGGMRHRLLVMGAKGRQTCRARRPAPRPCRPRCRGRRSPTRRRTAARVLPSMSRLLRGERAHQRLRRGQADRAHGSFSLKRHRGVPRFARLPPGPRNAGPFARRLLVVMRPDSQACAGSAKIVRPTAKPRTVGSRAAAWNTRASSRRRRLQTQQHDAPAQPVVGADGVADHLPCRGRLRFQLPPVGLDPERVQAAEHLGHGVARASGPCLPGDDLDQQLAPDGRVWRRTPAAARAPGCSRRSSGSSG